MNASARVLFTVILICGICDALQNDPFPAGFTMGTLGTVIDQEGPSGAQPWVPAVFYGDSLRFSFAMAGVSYYDAMDNFSDRYAYRTDGGGLAAFNRFVCKGSVSYFSFLDSYFEQMGYISFSVNVFPWLRAGTEFRGTRFGIRETDSPARTAAGMGFSLWLPWRYAAVSVAGDHIPVKDPGIEGGSSPVVFRAGLHSTEHRFGAQGVLVEYTPSIYNSLRFSVGEELAIYRDLSLKIAFTNNPVLIGFGIMFAPSRYALDVSFVNHAVLGWSKGLAASFNPGMRR